MKDPEKHSLPRSKEEVRTVDYEELEKIKRHYRRIGNLLSFIFVILILFVVGLWLYNKTRHKPLERKETTPTQNLWIPGIDYTPPKEKGE